MSPKKLGRPEDRDGAELGDQDAFSGEVNREGAVERHKKKQASSLQSFTKSFLVIQEGFKEEVSLTKHCKMSRCFPVREMGQDSPGRRLSLCCGLEVGKLGMSMHSLWQKWGT